MICSDVPEENILFKTRDYIITDTNLKPRYVSTSDHTKEDERSTVSKSTRKAIPRDHLSSSARFLMYLYAWRCAQR